MLAIKSGTATEKELAPGIKGEAMERRKSRTRMTTGLGVQAVGPRNRTLSLSGFLVLDPKWSLQSHTPRHDA